MTINYLILLLAALIGYLIGSIPFGYIYVKLTTGKDIRLIESGRTGGTNATRAAGHRIGILTGVSDVFKAAIAVWVVGFIMSTWLSDNWWAWARALSGMFAVVGHNWSIYMGFRGGAGLTPNVGWATAIWGWIFPISFLLLLIIFYMTGMASVVTFTLSATICLILAVRYVLGIDPSAAYLTISVLNLLMIGWSLRTNFKRILNGNERMVGPAAKRHQKK